MDTTPTPTAAKPKCRRRWYQFGLRTLRIGSVDASPILFDVEC
jgi:hypothetical protein